MTSLRGILSTVFALKISLINLGNVQCLQIFFLYSSSVVSFWYIDAQTLLCQTHLSIVLSDSVVEVM